MELKIDINKCTGCGLCSQVCIRDNITIIDGKAKELGNSNCFLCGHCMGICPKDCIRLIKYENSEDKIQPYVKNSISSNDFLNFLKNRRSIRWFKDKKIDKETFFKLSEAAYYSPSAQNIQDVEFVIIDEELYEFIELVYSIIKIEEDKFFRIKELGDYLKDNSKYDNHPLLWDGKQLILTFSTNHASALIATTRLELYAQTLGLGGFYLLFIQKDDELNHDKLMEFFPEINKNKHMCSAFIIGYPRIKYKRTIPHTDIKLTYK